jgi:hypothetical protein
MANSFCRSLDLDIQIRSLDDNLNESAIDP